MKKQDDSGAAPACPRMDLLRHSGLLWLRVLMGLGLANHGWAKVFGGFMEKLTQGVAGLGFPFPGFFAWAAALSELLGGILILLGLGTRPAAVFVFITMSVAAFGAHASDPLQVKELALAYWAMSGALAMTGPGRFSLDAWLCRLCRDRKKS